MASKLLDIKLQHEGKFLKFYNFVLDDGRNYEVISRRELNLENVNNFAADAVDILAFSRDFQKILIIKEWRVPVNDYIYALPAGLRESDETILSAAQRELFEETGQYISGVYKILPPAYQSAGMSNEAVATVVCAVSSEILSSEHSTKDEDITPMWITKKDAEELLKSNKMSGRCQMVLYWWLVNDIQINGI